MIGHETLPVVLTHKVRFTDMSCRCDPLLSTLMTLRMSFVALVYPVQRDDNRSLFSRSLFFVIIIISSIIAIRDDGNENF